MRTLTVALSSATLERTLQINLAQLSDELFALGFPDAIRLRKQETGSLEYEPFPLDLHLFATDADVRARMSEVSFVALFRRVVVALVALDGLSKKKGLSYGAIDRLESIVMTADGSRIGFVNPSFVPDWETWRMGVAADVRSLIRAIQRVTTDAPFRSFLDRLAKEQFDSDSVVATMESVIAMTYGRPGDALFSPPV